MIRLSLQTWVPLVVGLLSTASVHAEPVPTWSYRSQVELSDSRSLINHPELTPDGGVHWSPIRDGFATLSLNPTDHGTIVGSSRVDGFDIRATPEYWGESTRAGFDPNITRFRYEFTIWDDCSGESGTIAFTGGIGGWLAAGEGASAVYDWQLDLSLDGPAQQMIQLGDSHYTVTWLRSSFYGLGMNHPDGMGEPVAGSMAVDVVYENPEPSTLVMGMVAVTLGGFVYRRSRVVRKNC